MLLHKSLLLLAVCWNNIFDNLWNLPVCCLFPTCLNRGMCLFSICNLVGFCNCSYKYQSFIIIFLLFCCSFWCSWSTSCNSVCYEEQHEKMTCTVYCRWWQLCLHLLSHSQRKLVYAKPTCVLYLFHAFY